MAYQQPKNWVYGDVPNATELNKYATNLGEILAYYDGRNYASSGRATPTADIDVSVMQQNRHRWLVYRTDTDDAQLVSWIDPENDVYALPATPTDEFWTILDLEQVDWLAPGLVYTVEGCLCCFETEYLA